MRLAFLSIFLFVFSGLQAQLRVTTYFEQDTIYVGDAVGLTYELETQPNMLVTRADLTSLSEVTSMEEIQMAQRDTTKNWKEIFKSAEQFEVLNYGKWNSPEGKKILPQTELKWNRKENGGNSILTNTLNVTFWDEGHYVVPPLAFYYSINGKESILPPNGQQPAIITVIAPPIEAVNSIDTLTNLTPIQPILTEQINWKDYWIIYLSLAILGLIGLIWWLVWRSKSKEVIVEEKVVIIPPYELALQKLNTLNVKQLWQKGEDKIYQSELTYIIREYLEKQHEFPALESTTGQILRELKNTKVDAKWHDKIRDILQIADLVKFAKAAPSDDINERAMNDAIAFVEDDKKHAIVVLTEIDLNAPIDNNINTNTASDKDDISNINLDKNTASILAFAALSNPLNYEFANPWFFLLLGLLPILGIWYYLTYRRRYPELRMPHMEVLKGVTSWRGRLRILLHILRAMAFICLIIALARPQLFLKEVKRSGEGIDIFLAIDLSSSMLAQDFKPNRLEVSKREATEFIDRREFDRIGLAVFAGEAFAQCPLTTDHRIVKKFIDDLDAGTLQDGTAIGMGLAAAVNRLKESNSKSKIIILLTDGMNNAGYIQPMMSANLAEEFGIKVYTIGVGTQGQAYAPTSRNRRGGYNFGMVPVEIDEQLLNQIAKKTGGRYFRATSARSLEDIYKTIDKLEKTDIEIDPIIETSEEFHHFVRLALIFLLLEVVLRYTIFREIP